MAATTTEQVEYGDFQTPIGLATEVVGVIRRLGISPAAIVEPTCGKGAFVVAASRAFPGVELRGYDLNREHLTAARSALRGVGRASIREADFFDFDWSRLVRDLPKPVLFLGNPPWVTNAGLGVIASGNLPAKSNFQGLKGLDALTGKSNFDISEWMLLHLVEAARDHRATIAVLCKASTARRVLAHVWKTDAPVASASIYEINAMAAFGVSVAACLFVIDIGPVRDKTCRVFSALDATSPRSTLGWRDRRIVPDVTAYDELRDLSRGCEWRWRSGVKHDCSSVMELSLRDGTLVNGLGEDLDIEPTIVFPMLKSSDVAAGASRTSRFMIVPQREVGQETEALASVAPKTWAYLMAHGERLDRRGSSIYKRRPRFSIFGVGAYTFQPWKIAISGLYKRLAFHVVGPQDGQPVVFDDTVYVLSFDTEGEARLVHELLTSETAQRYFQSVIFWDAKRPITADVLNAISIEGLAAKLGRSSQVAKLLPRRAPKNPSLFPGA